MMNNYILTLDGEAIKIHNPVITLEQQLAEEDMSGQSSTTTASEQGQKAKTLNVSGLIKYSDVANLTRLFELAGKYTSAGSKHIYRVANSTAQAVKLRQCVFTGKINATQDSRLMAWNISFSLKERFSVPEKRETIEQQPEKALVIDDDEINNNESESLSYFEENILKVANDTLP